MDFVYADDLFPKVRALNVDETNEIQAKVAIATITRTATTMSISETVKRDSRYGPVRRQRQRQRAVQVSEMMTRMMLRFIAMEK